MSYYSEQDPLLPKDPPAPEIQGSRPQSLKDTGPPQAELGETEAKSRTRAFNDILAVILGLCFFATLAFIFVPDDVLDGIRPGPRTIEERVTKILTNTPLIGIIIFSTFYPYLIFHRRTQ
jgi:membrane dipeptidase